jgi:hypothetical protein
VFTHQVASEDGLDGDRGHVLAGESLPAQLRVLVVGARLLLLLRRHQPFHLHDPRAVHLDAAVSTARGAVAAGGARGTRRPLRHRLALGAEPDPPPLQLRVPLRGGAHAAPALMHPSERCGRGSRRPRGRCHSRRIQRSCRRPRRREAASLLPASRRAGSDAAEAPGGGRACGAAAADVSVAAAADERRPCAQVGVVSAEAGADARRRLVVGADAAYARGAAAPRLDVRGLAAGRRHEAAQAPSSRHGWYSLSLFVAGLIDS